MEVNYMAWLPDLVPPPNTRKPLSSQTFVEDLLPPILCYYATATLVVISDTILIRLALLPVTLWTIFRASTTVDLVKSFDNERLAYWNHGFLLAFTTMAMRVVAWTFQLLPYERTSLPPSDTTTKEERSKPSYFRRILRDSSDLFINLRGCDWDWSSGVQLPTEARPSSPSSFAMHTLVSAICHFVFFDNMHYLVQCFSPALRSAQGGTIFDASLPPIPRYLRSSAMTFFAGFTIYSAMQATYDLFTVLSVLLFSQSPSRWPPLFDAPWKSTSVNEFWTKRWHQLYRHQFIVLGGKPLYHLLGSAGAVMGVFFMSAVFHHFGQWGMGRGTDFGSIGGYFLLMGIGVVLERLWKRVTGARVQGWLGWIWAMAWVVGWGNMLVDAWARHGLFGSTFVPDSQRPSRYLLGLII